MRFKVDENLPDELADLINQHGHDALTVRNERLGGSSDERIAEVCKREDRILITLDAGFADIRTYPPSETPGMVVLRLPRTGKRDVLTAGRRLVKLLEKESPQRKLWIVDARRLRVRE